MSGVCILKMRRGTLLSVKITCLLIAAGFSGGATGREKKGRWNTGEEQIEEIRQKKRREINREKASKEGEPAIMNR